MNNENTNTFPRKTMDFDFVVDGDRSAILDVWMRVCVIASRMFCRLFDTHKASVRKNPKNSFSIDFPCVRCLFRIN